MRIRSRYQRQHMTLIVEFESAESMWPQRVHANVNGFRQARAELVRIAFREDKRPTRAWVSVYQFGNTTEAERRAAFEFWVISPWMGCMPPYKTKDIYLIGRAD